MRYLGKKSAASVLQVLLNIGWYLAIIAPLLMVGITLYSYLFSPSIPAGAVQLRIETPGLVFIFHEGFSNLIPPSHFWAQFLLTLPLFAVALVVIYNLRRIFATLVQEMPFQLENVRRTRAIGLAVLAGTVLSGVVHTFVGLYMSNAVQLPGLDLQAKISLNFTGIFLGAVILVLAEIFRQGAALQEEQDMTV